MSNCGLWLFGLKLDRGSWPDSFGWKILMVFNFYIAKAPLQDFFLLYFQIFEVYWLFVVC